MPSRKRSRAIRTIFLSKKMLPLSLDEQVNVVLSPAFYWFREAVLPAKNTTQAKKLAPSYFDAILPEGEYEYMAVAKTEAFWLFAYNPDLIAEALHDAGLRPNQIEAVYFAQTECFDLAQPHQINADAVLVVNEGVVSVVASRYVEAETSIESYLNATPRSRHKVHIALFRSKWLDEKQLGRFTLVAVLLMAVYLINFVQLRYQYKQQLIREAALKAHYKLPETSFQLKSMINSLEGKQRRQLHLRTVFKQILHLPLKKGDALVSLLITEKKADLQFLLAAPKHAEAITSALEKFSRVTSPRVKDNILYVSIAYE